MREVVREPERERLCGSLSNRSCEGDWVREVVRQPDWGNVSGSLSEGAVKRKKKAKQWNKQNVKKNKSELKKSDTKGGTLHDCKYIQRCRQWKLTYRNRKHICECLGVGFRRRAKGAIGRNHKGVSGKLWRWWILQYLDCSLGFPDVHNWNFIKLYTWNMCSYSKSLTHQSRF